MTDPATTKADLAATLAVIEEQMQRATNPTQLFHSVERQLDTLMSIAEKNSDEAAFTAIQQTWLHAKALAEGQRDAQEAALTALDIAATFGNQRDALAREHDELLEDIENVNLDNPHVKGLHEQGVDDAFEDFDGLITRCPGCDVHDNGHLPHIDHDAVNVFVSALFGHIELTDSQASALADFVNQFAQRLYEDEEMETVND